MKPLMHAVGGGDAPPRPKRMAGADLETIVLHDVELVGQRVDRDVAEPLVIIPAETALIERDGAGKEHRELSADDGGRMPFGRGVAGERGGVAMQADLDA